MEQAGIIAQDQINRGLTGRPKWKSNDSTSNGEALKAFPPLVVPDEIPIDIMARHLGCNRYAVEDDPGYQVIVGHLWGYQHSKTGWDDYAAKIDMGVRDIMSNIFRDCRENGFFSPLAVFRRGKKKIIFGQIIERDRPPVPEKIKPTLCYFCEERSCEEDHGGRLVINMKHCRRNT